MERIFGNSSTTDLTWKPEPRERGTYSILSTCLITLALCVWTAVHLNIPEHRGRWQQVWRKCRWVVIGFLAPEIGKGDAEEKAPEWTHVHSYFAAMGGFAFEIQDGDENFFPTRHKGGGQPSRLAIMREGLSYLGKHRPELIPRLTRACIEDKSKGSGLAKSIVCFQATWFCVQCLSRFGQGLPISLLELNTFGHALCSLVIYSLWWKKPLDVEEPEIIPVKGQDVEKLAASMCVLSDVERHKLLPNCLNDSQINFGVYWFPSGLYSLPVRDSRPKATRFMHWIRRFFEGTFSANPGRHKRDLLELKISQVPAQALAQGLTGPANATTRIKMGQSIDGISLGYFNRPDINEHESAMSLPFLDLRNSDMRRWRLAYQGSSDRMYPMPGAGTLFDTLAERIRNFPPLGSPAKQWPLYLGLGITGLVYGGLHCLAWNAPFPTDLERLFWRISSVTATSTGVLIALGFSWALMPPFSGHFTETRVALLWKLRLFMDKTGILKLSKKEKASWETKGILAPFFEQIMLDIIIALYVVFYALARLYLVVECFISLAHLPEGAYQVPKWSQYVPHIA